MKSQHCSDCCEHFRMLAPHFPWHWSQHFWGERSAVHGRRSGYAPASICDVDLDASGSTILRHLDCLDCLGFLQRSLFGSPCHRAWVRGAPVASGTPLWQGLPTDPPHLRPLWRHCAPVFVAGWMTSVFHTQEPLHTEQRQQCRGSKPECISNKANWPFWPSVVAGKIKYHKANKAIKARASCDREQMRNNK